MRFVVEPKNQDAAKTFAFSHRYVGSYTAGIFVAGPVSLHEPPRIEERLKLHCVSGGTSFVVDNLGATPSPFLGLRGNGYSLVRYEVPRDLPQGTETQCTLRTFGAGQLVSRFGQTEFYVAKESDL